MDCHSGCDLIMILDIYSPEYKGSTLERIHSFSGKSTAAGASPFPCQKPQLPAFPRRPSHRAAAGQLRLDGHGRGWMGPMGGEARRRRVAIVAKGRPHGSRLVTQLCPSRRAAAGHGGGWIRPLGGEARRRRVAILVKGRPRGARLATQLCSIRRALAPLSSSSSGEAPRRRAVIVVKDRSREARLSTQLCQLRRALEPLASLSSLRCVQSSRGSERRACCRWKWRRWNWVEEGVGASRVSATSQA
jgi:hypothetical protein